MRLGFFVRRAFLEMESGRLMRVVMCARLCGCSRAPFCARRYANVHICVWCVCVVCVCGGQRRNSPRMRRASTATHPGWHPVHAAATRLIEGRTALSEELPLSTFQRGAASRQGLGFHGVGNSVLSLAPSRLPFHSCCCACQPSVLPVFASFFLVFLIRVREPLLFFSVSHTRTSMRTLSPPSRTTHKNTHTHTHFSRRIVAAKCR